MIIDVQDQYSLFPKWAKERVTYYRKNKYTLNQYKAVNDKCVSFADYMIMAQFTPVHGMDIREAYLRQTLGNDGYEFEQFTDFVDYPEEMFNYDPEKCLDINHVFDNNDNAENFTIEFL